MSLTDTHNSDENAVVIESHEYPPGNTSSGSQNLGVVDEDLGPAPDGIRDTELIPPLQALFCQPEGAGQ